MRPLLSILFTCCALTLWGQAGNYFLSHYSPSEERFDYVCFDMDQDPKGVMYFATKAGILEFDGRDWNLLPGLSAVYNLEVSAAGEIYWAGAKGFGKVSLDTHGFQQAEYLSDSTVINVFQTLIVKDQVYFLTEEAVHLYDDQKKTTASIKPISSEHTFLKVFELFGVVYVNTDHGTYKIDQNKLVDSGLNLNEEVVFFARIDDSYVIATTNNKLYTCNDKLDLKPVALQDQAYIDASVIVSGSWLNRQLLALGTLRGGVIFVNPINGITQEIINYGTGLPDNEVFELMTDARQNVWVAHDYGFTKIAPYLPLRSFSHYAGLQGNLLCALSSQQTVYVGTSLGLFKLEKTDLYDEMVYYVDVEVKPSQQKARKNQPAAAPPKQETSSGESKKGGLFGFLKRNKNTPVKESAKPADDTEESSAQAQPKFRRQKRIEKILRSSQYEFKKVKGIDAKVTHLVEVQGRLLASGLGGLFEINDLAAKPIMEEPVRYLYAPSKSDFVIVSTYNDEVRTLRFAGKTIENSSLFNNVADQIHYIFEGVNNELWLCGISKIYRADVKGSDVRHKQTIEVQQRNTDRTVGAVWNGQVVLANADGFYQVQRQEGKIVRIDSLPKPSQYFAHNGSVVYRDRHGWNFLGSAASENNLQLLNVFQDLRFITSDKNSQNLWLISGSNELYKFFGNEVTPVGDQFPLFLKSIVNQDKRIVKLSEIIMDQEHSSVKFEVVQPDYINPQAVEYRYLLKGMQETWSEWASNNDVIDFPYLPTGNYTLQVEARNIFGKISSLEPLSFEVLPPYWKRSWFYALEFAIFASLVMLSFRLSTRYRIISRLLSLLTIILLIELIQTAIGATISLKDSSPVIDFFIQVVVALLVLPVEGYLRDLMMKSLDSKGKLYKFIVPQASPMIMRGKPEKFIIEKEKEVSGRDKK